MKKIIPFILLVIMSMSISTAQTAKAKKDPIGTWLFEAPYAPEGFNKGAMVFTLKEGKYAAAVIFGTYSYTSHSFTGDEFKLNGEKVKFENDTILFSVYIEGEEIPITLKMEDPQKMTGKAVAPDGEVPITLTKEVKAAAK